MSAAFLNLVSFSLFDRRDSDEPEDEYTQAPQAQNTWCMRRPCVYNELYGEITNCKKKKLCK